VEGVEPTPMRHDPNEKPIGQLDKINLLESILRKEQCFLTACTHVQREVSFFFVVVVGIYIHPNCRVILMSGPYIIH